MTKVKWLCILGENQAHILYDPVANRIEITRDVVFDETKAWEWAGRSISDIRGIKSLIVARYTPTTLEDDDRVSQSSVPESSIPSISNDPLFTSSPATPQSSMITPQPLNSSSAVSDRDSANRTITSSASSEQPRKYRSLTDIYDHTSEIEIADELLLMGVDEPICFEQAIHDAVWKEAIDTEIQSIEINQTWDLTTLPEGHKAIDLKWIFKLKKDQTGTVTNHKARLVEKGYVQRLGMDYGEVFAPVTRLETVQLLLDLVEKGNWEIHHLDVKSAFINGVLHEKVYISQSKGYVQKGHEHKVYKLLKAIRSDTL
ncbi:uncharacterized protein LOC141680818 [Apium graveolens]|uniref:uncharacterized protein LOC141680818 n=1 Tax=Apium graveolens TaxID=4045 RepID=UPI003D78CA0B